jgi:hypothetical protein
LFVLYLLFVWTFSLIINIYDKYYYNNEMKKSNKQKMMSNDSIRLDD